MYVGIQAVDSDTYWLWIQKKNDIYHNISIQICIPNMTILKDENYIRDTLLSIWIV